MGPITLSLGFAVVLAAMVSLIGRDGRREYDDASVVLALVYVWAIGACAQMVSHEFFPKAEPPFFMWINPPVDLVFGAFVALIYRRRPATWKKVIILTTAFQMTCHIAYALGPRGGSALYAYQFALNVSFLSQVACVMTPGGRYGLRRLFGRLPRRPSSVRQRRHGIG